MWLDPESTNRQAIGHTYEEFSWPVKLKREDSPWCGRPLPVAGQIKWSPRAKSFRSSCYADKFICPVDILPLVLPVLLLFFTDSRTQLLSLTTRLKRSASPGRQRVPGWGCWASDLWIEQLLVLSFFNVKEAIAGLVGHVVQASLINLHLVHIHSSGSISLIQKSIQRKNKINVFHWHIESKTQ